MSDEIRIRMMTKEDSQKVAEIDARCILNPWSKADFESSLSYPENYYLIAENAGEIAGFVGLIQFVDDGDITHIAVDEKFRRNHIASRLLEELFAFAKTKNLIAIHLEVREQNEAAQKLYKKYGFEFLAIRKNYYTNPVENGIVMVKHL